MFKKKYESLTGYQKDLFDQYGKWLLRLKVKAEETGVSPDSIELIEEAKKLFTERDKAQSSVKAMSELFDLSYEFTSNTKAYFLEFYRKGGTVIVVTLDKDISESKKVNKR